MSQTVPAPLPQGAGYAVLVAFGFAFAAVMVYITHLLRLYNNENNARFETFATAGRKIGTGLTCTAVLSSWLWSTAVLSSTVVTYNFGLAGSYWFGAGCLVQITFFAVVAIQSKLKTPHAHTILEVVKSRYGTTAHVLYTFLCLLNNLIAYVNMVLGASATIASVTGMSIIAALWLLPISVVIYTLSGGLKSTFLADYLHTTALLIIVCWLSFKTLSNPEIQSIHGLYELATVAAAKTPVKGNYGGSYLTLASPSALQFGVLHTLGNFGLVLMDSSYWQKAYSADIAAAVPGYIAAGVLYFSVPALLGGVVGLAAVGLSNNNSPIWPTMGRALTDTELNNGLPLAYCAQAVAGKGGAVAVLILIFMAVTSTTSAQLVAVGSTFSSDIYHSYINTNASEKWIIRMTHLGVILFAVLATVLAVVFQVIGLSLIWTLYFLGIIVCPGMVTISLTVLWKRQTWAAAVISPLVGLVGGLATWLATAHHYYGTLDVTTTGEILPCLWGTIVSAVVPTILSPAISFTFPRDNFDWERFSDIKLISDDTASEIVEKTGVTASQKTFMRKQSFIASIASLVLFLGVWVITPFSLYGARYVFSRPFFTGWVVVMSIWALLTLLFVVFLPPIEGRNVIMRVFLGAIGKAPPVADDANVPETPEGARSRSPAASVAPTLDPAATVTPPSRSSQDAKVSKAA
ncbi:putative DUR3-urea permease [Tilletiaria anomala UBC 951]|uniref:Putative DUR3-urea permease n=1 Tax=Tilletiaria anomala (strain ATCC 24038 / CBS 436.72 / UBC 951) TaxID=1037660 RepID=A0A066W085_TILAU|nr:putative DUR3-urea permease [Tilletiaria anomala UBC 951]KDN47161.1 putative DUR3-urea permease [Tilletiaria anomala UBC 951]